MSFNYAEIHLLTQPKLGGGLKFKKAKSNQKTEEESEPSTDDNQSIDQSTDDNQSTEPSTDDNQSTEPSTDDNQSSEQSTDDQSTQPKKKLSFKSEKKPIQFDSKGIAVATKENVDRMSERDLMEFCSTNWTLEAINPLMIQLADYIKLPLSSTKQEKCKALLKYKKEHPHGAKIQQVAHNNTYESFNWLKETKINYPPNSKNQFFLPHSLEFRQQIVEDYKDLSLTDTDIYQNRIDPKDDESTMKYQQFPQEYLDPSTPYRSLLLYHGLGSGKTRTSVETSTRFIENDMKIVVMLPGALRSNFIVELYKYGSIKHKIGIPNYTKLQGNEKIMAEKAALKVIEHYYDIITYNERGAYDKLKALTNPETNQLENRLIIVDEIHNLVSRMSKATNLSRQIYHFLMDRTYNCKLILMSGTPLLNDAYELGVLFNILRGKIRLPNGNSFTLFQENAEDFNNKFVNIYDKSVTNQQLFKRRINGLVSYYAGTTDKKGMAEVVKFPLQKIEMSDHQFQLYMVERYLETRKEKKNGGGKKEQDSESTGSAFRTYSRMVCNFAFPTTITRPKPVGSKDMHLYKKYQQVKIDVSQLDAEDLMDEIDTTKIEDTSAEQPKAEHKPEQPSQTGGKEPPTTTNKSKLTLKSSKKDASQDNDELFQANQGLSKKQREDTYIKLLLEALISLDNQADDVFPLEKMVKYGPKMAKMLQNMLEQPGKDGLIYIYTEFRMLEGVRIMGSLLKYHGYQKIDYTDINSFQDFKKKYPLSSDKSKHQLRYGIISSDEDSKQRKLLLEIYNHPENAHGEYVKVIMGTAASSEGISLMRVRQIHIMEPYWNMVRNDQVIGRGVRYGSHKDLPQDEQNVNIFQYQTTLSVDQVKEITEYLDNPRESDTSDEHIYKLAMSKDVINRQFLKMIKESAIDCGLNYLMNTKLDATLQCLDVPIGVGKYMYMPDINQDPEDQNFLKSIKYEEYLVAPLKFNGQKVYGYKTYSTGKPILDPPSIVYENKIYYNILTLYNYEMLKSGVEVKEKYYVVGTNILINA